MSPRALIGLAALCFACDDGGSTPAADAGLPPGVAVYALGFTYGKARPHADGGWTVTTDRGLHAHVEEGWIATWSAQLVPCPGETVFSAFVRRAWAGHGDLDDPSLADLQVREALHDPVAQTARVEYTAEAATYCKAHYLAAQLTHDTPAIALRGTVTVDGIETPFALQTDFATGKLGLFDSPYDPRAAGVTVYIERDLGMLLDGIDLLDPEADPAQLVFNLADATTLTLR